MNSGHTRKALQNRKAEIVRLLDFGLSRVRETEGSQTRETMTMPGLVAGTPVYIVPEQLLNLLYEGRSDV